MEVMQFDAKVDKQELLTQFTNVMVFRFKAEELHGVDIQPGSTLYLIKRNQDSYYFIPTFGVEQNAEVQS